MEENSNKRTCKSAGGVKFLKLYFVFSFVIFTAVLPIQSLYIPIEDLDIFSSKKDSSPINVNFNENDIANNDKEIMNDDDDDDDDDIDLEDALNDYYDSFLDELELEIKSVLEREAKIRAEKEREKKRKEEKYFPDYDYMSDMPAPEQEIPDKKSKVKGESQISLDDGNYTWAFYNGSNSTFDDIHMLQKLSRERMRELRLNAIKNQILSLRGGKNEGNETVPDSKQYGTLRELYEKNLQRLREWTSSNKYPEKVRSFYPSCDVPKNTDEDMWTNPNSMNLLFDLEFPKPAENATINIVAAKLRLFKKSQANFSVPLPEQSSSGLKSKTDKGLFGVQNFGIVPTEDDRQIRISVYWYTRSLRRNKIKRKLLDSQMFSVSGNEWTEFNIRTAVRSWRETRKNFGLFVTVEDEDGSLLPADQYLRVMNCSKWTATVRPIPSIIMDAAQHYMMEHPEQLDSKNNSKNKTDENGTLSSSFNFQNLPYPILDLCTVEVPESEGKDAFEFNAAKLALETQMLNLSRRRSNFDTQISNFTIVMKNENFEPRNFSKPDKTTTTRRRTEMERSSDSSSPRSNYFQTVGLGSPSAGQNRNVLVPIITKSELEMVDPSDLKLKAEMMRIQNDSPASLEKEIPRFRHNQNQWESFQKKVINHARLKNDSTFESID